MENATFAETFSLEGICRDVPELISLVVEHFTDVKSFSSFILTSKTVFLSIDSKTKELIKNTFSKIEVIKMGKELEDTFTFVRLTRKSGFIKHGYAERMANGIIYQKGRYVLGEVHGAWYYYSMSNNPFCKAGSLGSIITYKNGKKHGYTLRNHYGFANYVYETTIIDDHEEGKTKRYYSKNHWEEYFLVKGVKEGPCRKMYLGKKEKGNYSENKRNGKWVEKDENGKFTGFYKNDLKEGFWECKQVKTNWGCTTEKPSITPLYMAGNYLHGKRQGKWVENLKDDKGVKMYEYYYHEGSKNGLFKYKGPYTLGALKGSRVEKGYFINNKKNGLWHITLTEEINGEQVVTKNKGCYINDVQEGEWITKRDGLEIYKENFVKGKICYEGCNIFI